jgi:phage terminase large subunit-like protein
LYAAAPELYPFSDETIRLANPALGDFLSEREVRAMAQDAKRMPAREAEYRNKVLNQRIEATSPFVAPAVWKACGDPVDEEALKKVPVYIGLDLSEVRDLTAMVMIGFVNKKWHVKSTFWLPAEGLRDKSVADRVPYDDWAREGYLSTTEGKTIQYEHVAKHMRVLFNEYRVKKVAFDRWNMRHFVPWLEKAGFSERLITEHFVEFGQGMQSMSPALRDLEQVLLDGELAHGNNPILSMCVAHTTIVLDDAGNRKPSKRRSAGRIDGLVALAMAMGVAPHKGGELDIRTLIA